jgi:Na+/proline symporter
MWRRYVLHAQPSSTVGLLFGSLVVQLLPALVAAVWWRRAHRIGAVSGIIFGASIWALFIATPQLAHTPMTNWLPFALAAAPGGNMFAQRCIVSVLGNIGLLITLSMWIKPRLIDQIQAAAFIDLDLSTARKELSARGSDNVGSLKVLLAKFLGEGDAAVAAYAPAALHKRRNCNPSPT